MSTQTTSIQAVTAKAVIDATAPQLYHQISTRSGWLDWFGDKGFGNVHPKGILQIHHSKMGGNAAFIFKHFEPDVAVRFNVIDPETLSISEAVISLEEGDEGTTITVEHSGLGVVEEYEYWQEVWQDSLDSLKAILETGQDPRLWERPFLGVMVEEWVNEEYAAEKNLPVDYGMQITSVFKGKGAEQAGVQGGDIIVSLAGIDIVDYESLAQVYRKHKAGDTIEVSFYHGDTLQKSELTLSSFPVPDVPATADDVADGLAKFFKKGNEKIEMLLEDKNEAQMDFRPAAGEWNAKEIIAHLVAAEVDSLVWLGTYVSGREMYPYTSNVPARVKMLTAVYPTMDELLEKLKESQKELVAMVNAVPVDVAGRKTGLLRLAFTYLFDINLHYREHLNQLKETLEQAADVRAS